MAGFMFVAAIVLVLGVFVGRRLLQSGRRRALNLRPGRSVEKPILFRRFNEIDEEVERTYCQCGGPVIRMSEGSVSSGDRRLRVVHCECAECEESVDLFFCQDELLH